jgi:hypothetical protein
MSAITDLFNRSRIGQQRLAMFGMFAVAVFSNFTLFKHMNAASSQGWRLYLLPLLVILTALYFLARAFRCPSEVSYARSVFVSWTAFMVGTLPFFHLLR